MKQRFFSIQHIIYLLIACSGLSQSVQAQKVYSLKSCLESGLQNNYSMQITHNQEQISKNNATLANAGYLPTLDFSAGYKGNLDNIESKSRATGEIIKNNGVYDQTANVGLNLNWTIFDGFNISTTYKQLKELERQGETNTRIAIEDFIATLASEYYNYLQQEIRLKNLRYAVTLSKERMRIVEERYHIGSFSRLDYQQAKVDFNADSAQYMKQQELLHSSRIHLNELMANESVNQPLLITDSVIDVNAQLIYDDLWTATLATNANLLKADQNITLSQLDYKKINSRNYPYLKLNTGYGYTFNKYDINATSRRGDLGLNAGVTIGFNIFDGNRRREKNNASIAIKNARLERQELELTLRSDFSNLWQAYRNNQELLNLERQNLISAKENHEIAMERYMLGNLPGIEMREAQKSLLDAEERILSAEYSTKLCEISLLQLSGKITRYLE
ncbi:outer membrane protein TolC [Bacteroides reticulotermitis]|nr:TolC family protein [Bacteroides reticulotermitis]MBB4045954.1 outer membrane protein TolC [Bacteroides reticulotermitis]